MSGPVEHLFVSEGLKLLEIELYESSHILVKLLKGLLGTCVKEADGTAPPPPNTHTIPNVSPPPPRLRPCTLKPALRVSGSFLRTTLGSTWDF